MTILQVYVLTMLFPLFQGVLSTYKNYAAYRLQQPQTSHVYPGSWLHHFISCLI